jgi:uracil-DNA glycosylase
LKTAHYSSTGKSTLFSGGIRMAKRKTPSQQANEPSLCAEAPTWSPPKLATGWNDALRSIFESESFQKLQAFLGEERKNFPIYPPESDVFSAFQLTTLEAVKVLILGQDPYHNPGEAHGLCFSVRPGITVPPSLKNIYKELKDDLGINPPKHGFLEAWAKQGVLLVNAVMTVRENQPNSHKDQGWEKFTDAVIAKVNEQKERVVFVLWGAYAQKKAKLIDTTRHVILASAHPSPLSAKNGFFGSKPFSKINAALEEAGRTPIGWESGDQ